MDEYLKAIGGIYAMIIEKDGDNTYIAEAKTDAASKNDAVWRVRRVKVEDVSGVERTTVSWAGGHPGFSHAANDMANLTYANY
ncbi:MAG: hypothetical protein IJS15_02020 [Victivallales bacterium]|nr:hypothetical protein [Victivallales bacterium]